MTRLTIDEYKLEHDDSRWPETIAQRPDVLAAFMIEFDKPDFLCGPFGGSFGLVTIRDARKGPNRLYTETETYNRVRTSRANSLYHMPWVNNAQAGLTRNHEYISGWHDKETFEPVSGENRQGSIFFMTRNTLPGSATLDHPHLEITQNSSFEIDGLDMLRLFKHMAQELPPEEVIRRLGEAEAKIEQSIQAYLENEADSTPTVERPILLTLQGNDDSSWGKTFATLELALEYVDEIEATAKTTRYPKMNFTN
nr:hypothetical protein [Neorhizobium tomejilense]